MKTLIKKWLTHLAKKFLNIVPKSKATAITTQLSLQVEQVAAINNELKQRLHYQNLELDRFRVEQKLILEKYPEIWLRGNVSQGVVQIKKLKRAFEFYREENRLCIFVPWKQAEGRNPKEFVPEWLEIDHSLKIESIMDKMQENGIIYKIPILGWNDAIDLKNDLCSDHPTYQLDGSIVEKPKSYRTGYNFNAVFRRELVDNNLKCHVYAWNPDIPPGFEGQSIQLEKLLPNGKLRLDNNKEFTYQKLGDIHYWMIPITEESTALV